MQPLMPPIDSSDKLFHDGNPLTGEKGTIVTATFLNNAQGAVRDTQSELIAVLGAVAMAPDSTKSGQLLTALKLLISSVGTGVLGQPLNLKMNIPFASATATLTADEVLVESSLGGSQYRLANVNKTFNLGITGAGGMDVGTLTAGYVAIYLIYNPLNGTSALLGVNTTNVVAPEVYGGNAMPAGYTASALVSVWRVASGKLVVGYQSGREISVSRDPLLITSSYSSSLSAPWNSLDISPIYPPNTTWVEVDVAGITGTNTAFYSSGVSGAVDANNLPSHGVTWPSYLGTGQAPASAFITKKQTFYYLFTQSTGNFNSGLIYSKKYRF